MRIRIKINGSRENITLPVRHNEILQGIIYHHIDTQLAKRIHNKGTKDPESDRGLKLFTFSRLISPKSPVIDSTKNTITFYPPLSWIIASPIHELIISLYNTLIKNRAINLKIPEISEEQIIYISSIWIEPPPKYKNPVLIETLSPITVYRTEEKNGKRYTHYYSPLEPEFNKLILDNLRRKYRTITGRDISLDDKSYIKPFRIAKHENIVYYKDILIKGWSGIFEMSLSEDVFSIAFSCGLGAKNSQGFGCVGLWRNNP